MNQLEQRVLKMERHLKFYRMFFVLIIAIIGVFVLLSSAEKDSFVPEKIQAKSFQIVDNNNNVLVDIGMDKGNGTVSTFTNSGQRLVKLFSSEGGGGGINTFDTDGEVLFKVTRTVGGGSYMALFNSRAKEIAEFGVTNGESGYMRLNDKYGDKMAWITYTTDGGGYFALLNNNQETISLSTPRVGGRISVINRKGNRVAYIGTQENEDGNITISNAEKSKLGSIPANY